MSITNKKKGFTLLEVVISLGISLTLLLVIVKLSSSMVKEYFLDSKSNIIDDSLDNAMLNLDNTINGYLVSTIEGDEAGDKIQIKYDTDIEKQYYKIRTIYYSNNKLMISTTNYDANGLTKGENVVLNNVNKFNVYKKGKLIYYEIIMESGEVRIRCI